MLIVHIPSWFPIPEKPLNGNFIFRHIESLGESVKSVIFHHVHDGFNPKIPNNAELFPVTVNNFGKFAPFKAYMTAFEQLIQQYGKPDILHLHVALPLDESRIYKMVTCTKARSYFVPYSSACMISDKVEYGSHNKMERSLDGIMVKTTCVKLKIDRLGHISI